METVKPHIRLKVGATSPALTLEELGRRLTAEELEPYLAEVAKQAKRRADKRMFPTGRRQPCCPCERRY